MATKITVLVAYLESKLLLPTGYRVECGTDGMLLRRGDGSVVTAFGAANIPPAKVARLAERGFCASKGTR